MSTIPDSGARCLVSLRRPSPCHRSTVASVLVGSLAMASAVRFDASKRPSTSTGFGPHATAGRGGHGGAGASAVEPAPNVPRPEVWRRADSFADLDSLHQHQRHPVLAPKAVKPRITRTLSQASSTGGSPTALSRQLSSDPDWDAVQRILHANDQAHLSAYDELQSILTHSDDDLSMSDNSTASPWSPPTPESQPIQMISRRTSSTDGILGTCHPSNNDANIAKAKERKTITMMITPDLFDFRSCFFELE